jgi:two-component system, OmpR family, phosphate regulon sensor histidine kinase PhoR
MKNRLRISLVLMVVSMVLLAAFQGWWLYKSYHEEKETLSIHTSILFRETLFRLQTAKLELDTNLRIPFSSRPNAVGVMNVLREKIRDTGRISGSVQSNMIVSVDRRRRPTDSTMKTYVRYRQKKCSMYCLALKTPAIPLRSMK